MSAHSPSLAPHGLPSLVVHCDWSAGPAKRWMSTAIWQEDGYHLLAAEAVGPPGSLLQRLRERAGPQAAILVGFDFPIGLPLAYAQRCEIDDFRTLLPRLGTGEWVDFYQVAETPAQVHLRRPFYPQRPGAARRQHLLDGLGLAAWEALYRRCDRRHDQRRAASPLFWTLGGQQVGKAAISGWRDLIVPALHSHSDRVNLWPFAGPLFDLLQPGRITLAETYPGEFYHHFGLRFRTQIGDTRIGGKRSQFARQVNSPQLFAWMQQSGVQATPEVEQVLQAGFGNRAQGEDQFDSFIGLAGMLNVLLGRQSPGEPHAPTIRKIEGWILGQTGNLPQSS